MCRLLDLWSCIAKQDSVGPAEVWFDSSVAVNVLKCRKKGVHILCVFCFLTRTLLPAPWRWVKSHWQLLWLMTLTPLTSSSMKWGARGKAGVLTFQTVCDVLAWHFTWMNVTELLNMQVPTHLVSAGWFASEHLSSTNGAEGALVWILLRWGGSSGGWGSGLMQVQLLGAARDLSPGTH